MMSINLLPDRKKRSIEKLINFIFIKNMLEMTLLTSAFIAMLLLWSSVALSEQYAAISNSALLITSEASEHNQANRDINRIVKQLNLAGNNFFTISDKLHFISAALPPNTRLNSLDIDRKSGTISISGTAKTRDELLLFLENLKTINWLDKIEAPTSQLFQKENINFEIKGTLKDIPLLEPDKKQAVKNNDE